MPTASAAIDMLSPARRLNDVASVGGDCADDDGEGVDSGARSLPNPDTDPDRIHTEPPEPPAVPTEPSPPEIDTLPATDSDCPGPSLDPPWIAIEPPETPEPASTKIDPPICCVPTDRTSPPATVTIIASPIDPRDCTMMSPDDRPVPATDDPVVIDTDPEDPRWDEPLIIAIVPPLPRGNDIDTPDKPPVNDTIDPDEDDDVTGRACGRIYSPELIHTDPPAVAPTPLPLS